MNFEQDDLQGYERETVKQLLKNAQGHIAEAYAHVTVQASPEHNRRVLRETLDAVDWLRRALEHMAPAGIAVSWSRAAQAALNEADAEAWWEEPNA